MTLGQHLRACHHAGGATMREIAAALGVSVPTVYRWHRDEQIPRSASRLLRIPEVYRMDDRARGVFAGLIPADQDAREWVVGRLLGGPRP